MTNDEIRELAKEAGFKWGFIKEQGLMDGMVDFAKLVAQHEREACAQFIETGYVRQFENPWRDDLSAAIRARKQA
jgi:hypothetical protein